MKKIKAFFFDRDNTLIQDKGYTYKTNDLKFLPGVIRGLQYLNNRNIRIIVITNQSGIARGYFKLSDVKKFHKFMNKQLLKKNSKIDDFFICGCHPDFSKNKCLCRKPSAYMLNLALKKWKLKKSETIMMGDKKSDNQASKAAGIKFIYKKKNYFLAQIKKFV